MRALQLLTETTIPTLWKITAAHCQSIKISLISDTFISNNLINGYAKCDRLNTAVKLFDEMHQKDTASWNTVITGYVNSGSFMDAWDVLKSMKSFGFLFNGYTFGSTLKGVATNGDVVYGQQLHSDLVKMGFDDNVYAASSLLDMYAKCKKVEDAHKVFMGMPERNTVSWNALIAGYAEMGNYMLCIDLFMQMEQEGVRVDDATFAPILALLDDAEFYKLTRQLHGKIMKLGLEHENTVTNATIMAYSECRCIEDAVRVFCGAERCRDLVTWNSMLAAYLRNDLVECGFQIFSEMVRRKLELDYYSYSSVISACSGGAQQSMGKSVHGLVIKKGVERLTPVSNSLICMYSRSSDGSINDAQKVFESMNLKDLVSWNTILTGLSQKGLSENALWLFREMHLNYLVIDQYAFAAALRSCSDLATLRLGQQIHVFVIKCSHEQNEYVASGLIFMYSKCGIVEDSWKSFEASLKDSSVTWNSIIFAYAQHGQGKIALDLFYLMTEINVKKDHITFVAALTACSHIGLIEEGIKLLKSMKPGYGVSPQMENYACAIDLLGRAGRLTEARELIEDMPFEADAMVWKTFLGACRACGDIELATQVANHLLELEPEEHCTYVLLSDIYGNLKRWDESARVKKLMREKGVKKVPGWSWIEMQNHVHAFNAEDHSHPNCKEIYQMLQELTDEIKLAEDPCILDVSFEDLDLASR